MNTAAPFLVDSHCHLDFPQFRGREDDAIAAMKNRGVAYAMTICTSLESFPATAELIRRDCIFAACGVHPLEENCAEPDADSLIEICRGEKILAVGETGLDYKRGEKTAELQRERFAAHIRAANFLQKPLVIHTRDSAADAVNFLRGEGASHGGVLHCFTGEWKDAKAAFDLGFAVSFSGIVTFKSAGSLREIAVQTPREWYLVETDSPYLAPEPHRGRDNQPAFVRDVAERIAQIRGMKWEAVAEETTANFRRIFNAPI